jgi:hypothetical protein
MKVSVDDEDYPVLSSSNTSTTLYTVLYPEFEVVYDTDGDLLDDNFELQLAEKFKPVLHKHSWELQAGLSNVDWLMTGRARLKAYNLGGDEVHDEVLTGPDDLHTWYGWVRDSFGEGSYWTQWKLNIENAHRYQAAPPGLRPLYYHVYKDGSYYYLQYWMFFGMNDIADQTENHVWHESDFEHVSLKVDASQNPVAVNFYRHEGGRTVSPSNCWWSSSASQTYSGITQGYGPSRTHLHIWVAANAHAAYNRYDKVYHVVATSPFDFLCKDLESDDHIDNVDYDPSGHNLFFTYDYLDKLGEYMSDNQQHGYTWFEHYGPKKSSKEWLAYVGRFGESWTEGCLGVHIQGTDSPLSPVFDLSGQPSHEWTLFTLDYSQEGFGNLEESSAFAEVSKTYDDDPIDDD